MAPPDATPMRNGHPAAAPPDATPMRNGYPRASQDATPMQNGAPPQPTFGMDPRFFGQGRQGVAPGASINGIAPTAPGASINGIAPAFGNLPPGGSPMGGEVPP